MVSGRASDRYIRVRSNPEEKDAKYAFQTLDKLAKEELLIFPLPLGTLINICLPIPDGNSLSDRS
jgi:hypothetical protein